MKRFDYDMSYQQHDVGKIGRVKGLGAFRVEAGASIGIDFHGQFRLAPLRRYMVMEIELCLAIFSIPMRHLYPNHHVSWVENGPDENITFPNGTSPINEITNAYGINNFNGKPYPLWVTAGYNRIWNRFYRSPSYDAEIKADNYNLAVGDERAFGMHCARAPTPYSRVVNPNSAQNTAANRKVTGTSTGFDLVDLAKQKVEYGRDQASKYYAQRYTDLLKRFFGGSAGTDADERPTLLSTSRKWLSGRDINGTGDSNLGSFTGKSYGAGRVTCPLKFMNEHSAVFILGYLRFPEVHRGLTSKLYDPNPSYIDASGDARIISKEPPVIVRNGDFHAGGSNPLGERPFGDAYRWQPSYVAGAYANVDGFPFVEAGIPQNSFDARMATTDYSDIFQTDQLAEWQVHANCKMLKRTPVPPPESSIFAGAS